MVALVDKQAVNPQLLKGHEIIRSALLFSFSSRDSRDFRVRSICLMVKFSHLAAWACWMPSRISSICRCKGGLLPLSGHGGF